LFGLKFDRGSLSSIESLPAKMQAEIRQC
jgi:hypothetical protein